MVYQTSKKTDLAVDHRNMLEFAHIITLLFEVSRICIVRVGLQMWITAERSQGEALRSFVYVDVDIAIPKSYSYNL